MTGKKSDDGAWWSPIVLLLCCVTILLIVGLAIDRLTMPDYRRMAQKAGVGRYEMDQNTGKPTFVFGCRKCAEREAAGK